MRDILIPLLTAGFGGLLSWILVKILIKQAQKALEDAMMHFTIENILPAKKLNESLLALSPFIDQKLEEFFKTQLPLQMPMISMFIGETTSTELKQVFKQELDLLFPDFIHQWGKSTLIGLKNDTPKWNSIIQAEIQKRATPLYIAAIVLGFAWGCLVLLII